MKQQTRRTPAKKQKVDPVVNNESVPVKSPVAQPAVSVEVKSDKSTDDKVQKRQQTSKILNISIQPARVRRRLDTDGLNSTLELAIDERKQQLDSYKSAKQHLDSKTKLVDGKPVPLSEAEIFAYNKVVSEIDPKFEQLEDEVRILSKEKTRFSDDASVVLSIVADELIKQMTVHAMDRALEENKKIIQLKHLHEVGIEKIPLYALIKSLPLFVETSNQFLQKHKQEELELFVKQSLAKAEKDFKKKYEIKKQDKSKDEKLKDEKPKDEKPKDEKLKDDTKKQTLDEEKVKKEKLKEDHDDERKTPFKFFIGTLCKKISSDPKYESISVSDVVKVYLSDLLIQFIDRVGPLVKLTSMSMKNKTINGVAVFRVVESLLIDGHRPVESFSLTGKGSSLVVQKSVYYPTSGVEELRELVDSKLKNYKSPSN